MTGQLRVKKLDPVMRRRKPDHSREPMLRRIVLTLRDDSQAMRSLVQGAFVLLCVWIGIEFHMFMAWGMSDGSEAFVVRPPGVEGFLPISALISLKYWLLTGTLNDVHPSGLFILLAIVVTAILAKKAFCAWLCPIGTLSESLWMAGQKLFGRNLALPKWADYPLRGLKYLLLAFFVWAVAGMSVDSLQHFIYSPYNKVADIKMYLFFAHLDPAALWVILVLIGLSVVIRNFWCRYLCPYGALLGLASLLSPLKITRAASSCIDCNLCTRACPSLIQVHAAGRVWSDECNSCMRCVESCPVRDTLVMSRATSTAKSSAVPGWVFGTLVVGVFVAITGLAMLTGNWQNGLTQEEYARRFRNLDSPVYQHNRGSVPDYKESD